MASRRGEATALSAVAQGRGSGDLLLSVRDDGVGMSEKTLALLNASLEEGGAARSAATEFTTCMSGFA